jgi:hypothetical protein
MTIAGSLSPFTRFSLQDFDSIFSSGHVPQNSSAYTTLITWVSKRKAHHPPDECRAQLLYYVRNALVHSKLGDRDPFLFGPYEGPRAEALVHLVSDMRDLIRDLIAV